MPATPLARQCYSFFVIRFKFIEFFDCDSFRFVSALARSRASPRSDMWGVGGSGRCSARVGCGVAYGAGAVVSRLTNLDSARGPQRTWHLRLRPPHTAPVAPLDCRVNKARTAVCVHTRERLRERVSTRARPRHLWLEAPRLAGPRPTAAYGKAQRGHSSRRLPTPRSRYVR